MKKFSEIKTKILSFLVENYEKRDKQTISKIIKLIKEDDDFRELYLFYEEIENKKIEDEKLAETYVDEIRNLLLLKRKKMNEIYDKFSFVLDGGDSLEKNEIYELMDTLSMEKKLNNLDTILLAKKKLVEHIVANKDKIVEEEDIHTENESVLFAVLTNNFNNFYSEELTEEEKIELRKYIGLTDDELKEEFNIIKDVILEKTNTLIKEEQNEELVEKLEKVNKEVLSTKITKFNLFKLKKLNENL